MQIFNKGKMKEIMEAPELLRIEPYEFKLSKTAQAIIISSLAVVYAVVVIKMIRGFNPELIFATGAYAVLIIAIMLLGRKATPFVITNRGLLKYPYVAEFWEDLENYTWETFTGFSRLPLQPADKVTTLYLVNKGGILRQRNIENRTGHTVLGNCGIFFSAEQIALTDKLFQDHGIKRITTENKTSAQQNAPGDAG